MNPPAAGTPLLSHRGLHSAQNVGEGRSLTNAMRARQGTVPTKHLGWDLCSCQLGALLFLWLLWRFFVDTDVVNEHGLRKRGVGCGCPRPTASDGHVEKDEERMIEDPFRFAGKRIGREGRIQLAIEIETDHIRLPLDCIDMKIVLEAPIGCQL